MRTKPVLLKVGTTRAIRVTAEEAKSQIASGGFYHLNRKITTHRNGTETVRDAYGNANGQRLTLRENFSI